MKTLFALLGLVAAMAGDSKPTQWDFKDAAAGKLPAGWSVARTGEGKGSEWKIVEDKDAPGGKALAQTSAEGKGSFFNICVVDGASYTDVDMTVAFKAVAGEEDQGGGLVWRYQDADHYYVARYNPLEKNFRVYTVVGGKRSAALASARVELDASKWHTLRIVHKGDKIQCYLNDKLHLEAQNDEIKKPGKIGLWTKADAQTRFADLRLIAK